MSKLYVDPSPAELAPLHESERVVSGIALLVGQLRVVLRRQHYSRHTEKAYVGWLRRFFGYCRCKHPVDVPRQAVAGYLSSLSAGRANAATQQQAASALAFLFREVLGRRLDLRRFERARVPHLVPAVLSPAEVELVLGALRPPVRLMAALMYGAGLRLGECCRLRVRDLDFEAGQIAVRGGKGAKDRLTLLPKRLTPVLRDHLETVRGGYEADRVKGSLNAEAAAASDAWPWTWVFPGVRLRVDRRRGRLWRSHVHPNVVQREFAAGVRASGLEKRATCHTLRHSFAVSLIESGHNIRVVQELLGHDDVATTLIYAKRPRPAQGSAGAGSPFDGRTTYPIGPAGSGPGRDPRPAPRGRPPDREE